MTVLFRPRLLPALLALAFAPAGHADASDPVAAQLAALRAESAQLDARLAAAREVEALQREIEGKRAALARLTDAPVSAGRAEVGRDGGGYDGGGQPRDAWTTPVAARPPEVAPVRYAEPISYAVPVSYNEPAAYAEPAAPAAPAGWRTRVAAADPGSYAPGRTMLTEQDYLADYPAVIPPEPSRSAPSRSASSRLAQAPELSESMADEARTRRAPSPAPVPVTRPAPAATPAPLAQANPATPAPRPPATAAERREIEARIADLKAQMASWLDGGVAYRQRSGTEGLSSLAETDVRVGASVVAGRLGRITANATSVSLDSGGPAAPADAALVGSSPILPPTTPVALPETNADGVAVSLGLERPGFRFDIGSTPLGFEITNVVGGVAWQPQGTPLSFELERRAVKDSLLSYAGLTDPVTGKAFGGVTANVLRIGAGGGDDFKLGGSLAVGVLTGEDVVDNRKVELYSSAMWAVDVGAGHEFEIGAEALAMHYQRNLSSFTLGHGGYFSPQRFFRPSLAASWVFGDEDSAWRVRARAGWQTVEEDDSPYFPADAAMQLAAGNLYFGARSSSGFAYGAEGGFAQRLSPHFSTGGWFRLEGSPNYDDFSMGLYLQYHFEPQRRSVMRARDSFPSGN